jgi:thiamine-phosphate pyrophosphorylase
MLLCYVTDRKLLGPSSGEEMLLTSIQHAAEAGVDWIQIREKDLSGRKLIELVRRVKEVLPEATRLVVNDRLDAAIAGKAAGVHLGASSVPAPEVIRWSRAGNAPADFLVGVSCHSLEEAVAAARAGASYIFFGPVFGTPSKDSFGPPQGTRRLAEVCRSVQIPVLAIGGVNRENAEECLRAGASGIAAIRLFQQAGDGVALARIVSRLHAIA